MTLFEYFSLRGNVYLAKGRLIDSVSDLICTVNKRLLNNSKRRNKEIKSPTLSTDLSLVNKLDSISRTNPTGCVDTVQGQAPQSISRCDLNDSKKKSAKVKDKLLYTSYRKLVRILYPYDLLMRYRFNLATYDELRSFLVTYTANSDDFHIPLKDEDLKSEFLRILNFSMIKVAYKLRSKIRAFAHDLFTPREDGKETQSFIDQNDYSHPLYYCIKQQFQKLTGVARDIAMNKITLEEVIETFTLLDPIKVLNESSGRKIKQKLLMGTIVRQFIKELKFDRLQQPLRKVVNRSSSNSSTAMSIVADAMVSKMTLTSKLGY